jgi:hypothetical protein
MDSVEVEQAREVVGEAAHVVADAADAELTELREVLADLGRGEMEMAGELLRGDVVDPLRLELPKRAQVDREPVDGERGDLLASLGAAARCGRARAGRRSPRFRSGA